MVKANGKRNSMMRIATPMKEVMKMTRKMEWDNSHGKVVIYIEVVTKKTSDTAMAKCTGLMALAIRVSGRKEFNMELAGWSSLMDV